MNELTALSEHHKRFKAEYGYGPGDEVSYPLRGERQAYVIKDVSVQGNGEPVAWLSGVSGCVPLHQISHIDNKVAP